MNEARVFRALSAAVVGLFLCAGIAVAQPTALSLEKVKALIQIKTPDTTVASEIGRRGLTFVPTREVVAEMRRLGAGPATVEALDARRPLLDDAREVVPGLLKEVFAALDQGDPQRVRDRLSPAVVESATKLDAICRPFAYRAHYVEQIVERPGRQVEARVRALLQPMEERAFVLVLARERGQLVIQDVLTRQREWQEAWEARASDIARKFAYGAVAGRRDVMQDLASPGLFFDDLASEECARGLQDRRELGNPAVQIRDEQGLKAFVTFPAWGSDAIVVDQVDGKDRVVRFAAPCKVTRTTKAIGSAAPSRKQERAAAEDPGIEGFTLKRFGIALTEEAAPLASSVGKKEGGPSTVEALGTLLARAEIALYQGETQPAGQLWDEVLAAGGEVSFPACRERFLGCDGGVFSFSAQRVRFLDTHASKYLFDLAPRDVVLEGIQAKFGDSVGFRFSFARKGYTFFFTGPRTCVDGKAGIRVVACDRAQLAQQAFVADYVIRALGHLASSGAP